MKISTNNFAFLVLPLNQRIVDKCIKNAHQGVLVVSQKLHGYLTRLAERAFNTCYAKRIYNILGEAEWNSLWRFESFALRMTFSCCETDNRTDKS